MPLSINNSSVTRACPVVPGYTLFVGKDISGFDIVRLSSVADGAAKCSADPSCNSFNYYVPGSEGYIKTVAYTSARAVASANICFYAKDRLDSSACGAIAEQYGLRPKTGTGGTLPADVQKLWTSHACDAKVCMYLVDKYKIIEGVSWGALPEDWKAAWSAIPCSPGPAQRCAPSAGYLVTPNEDHTGDDISQATSGTAAATCTANAKCLGFNLAGWLKTSNALTEPTANTCYYQKLSALDSHAVPAQKPLTYDTAHSLRCTLLVQYNIRPNYSWGTVTSAAMTAWSANNCDHKSCFYLDHKYGSAIPDLYKPSFASLGCAARVNASTCAKVPGYVATEGVDRKAPADELGYYPANASATCSTNVKCQAFTGDGWLKGNAKPNILRSGACWYSKLPMTTTSYTASYASVSMELDASGSPTTAAVAAFVQSLKTNITNTWGVSATNINVTTLLVNGKDVTSMTTSGATGRRRSLFLGYAVPTRPNDYFIDFDELSVIGGTLNYNGFNFGPGFQLFGTQGFSNTPASTSIIPDDSHDIDTQNPVVLGVPDDGCITVPAGFTGIDMWVNFACDSGKCVAGATPACHVCDVKGDGSVNNVIRAYNVENCPLDAATDDSHDIDTQNPVVLGVPDDGCITVPAGFTGIDMWVNFACDSGKCVAGATPACHVCDVKGDGSVNNVIRAYNVENCPLDAATGDARIVADWTYSRTPAGIIGGVSQGKGWNYWKWQNVKQSSSQTIKSIRFINRNVHRPRAATYDSEKWWLMIACPVAAGYTLIPGKDIAQYDIARISSISGAVSQCDANPSCKSFNWHMPTSGGYIKTVTYSASIAYSNSDICYYAKACPAVPGYTLFVGKDISGFDIVRLSSVADGAAKCSAEPSCNSFNYYVPGSEGYIKTVAYTSARAVASANICFYAKDRLDSAACGAIAEQYGLRPKTGTGGTLPADVQKLWTSHACDAKVCMYLVDKYKIIEGASFGTLPEDWKAAWSAIPCSPGPAQRCAPSAGYLVTPNEDHTGDDISQATSGTAAATCTANAKCLGFNLAGWLKTSNALTEPTANTCYYQKLSGAFRYSIRPNYSWGFVTGAAMTAWSANNCDHKSCFYLDHKYGSAIPDLYKPSFASLGCAARVNASTCAKVPGYVATEGVDRKAPADELGYYPANASATCSANVKCQAFTGDGWLKGSNKPNIVRPGACFYNKHSPEPATTTAEPSTASKSAAATK
ncbi:hypothetical protein GPECTOR_4g755 [Gonium pectorale]|uniref:Apple domain-containing protein n=1 Tax=Gonium pectorale TaxID=33097 RepID=A0A150GXR5_GONPE|nr:hypothetical protein GPECTOR_4g755 [Gonium pectorale]|eukprot:KXZ54687.1 hypothetical protein GPECTOR_4g755 [Gonium pectorale]